MPDTLRESASCRHCGSTLTTVFADLGATPVANDYLSPARRDQGEPFYPLKAYVCGNCRLVQLRDFHGSQDLFRDDYAYFSSFSTSWLQHARSYVECMQQRLRLGPQSLVVEVASNDGYLLQYFKQKGVPILGIEPCKSVADFAVSKKDIPTRIEFFGRESAILLAKEGFSADLIVANNVLGHVPDINDFVSGFTAILKPEGVATFEFPHLLNLIRLNEFDTIYHEHFSYLSLLAAERIFLSNGLRIFDVERLSTHGGSLRLFACRTTAAHERTSRVDELSALEREAGLHTDAPYIRFSEQVRETKRSLLELLIGLKRQGSSIVGYGAPAKGNTLLNYCGIGGDILDFTVDRSPHKQGFFLPGTRLEIRAPEAIDRHKPDFVLILPWNLQDEVMGQLAHIGQWDGKFIIPIPRARIVDAPHGAHPASLQSVLESAD